jgi:uncharacterized protein YegL
MADDKIRSLNHAIREAIPHMRDTAANNPFAEVKVRAIKFSTDVSWHIPTPTPVENFQWVDLEVEGITSMGKALELAAEALDVANMGTRALTPVLVLISDGQPTDNFKGGLDKLMKQPWGKKAVRIAIAIGGDADKDVLQEFIGHPEYKPLEANNPEALVRMIRFVSTAVLQTASSPPSRRVGDDSPVGNVPIPSPPEAEIDENDVW